MLSRRLLCLLTLCFITTVAFAQVSYNGSFEAVNSHNLPVVWFAPLISAAGTYEVCIDTTVSFDGKNSLHIAPAEKWNSISVVTFWQNVNLEAIGPVKVLKIVEYVKTGKFDSSSVMMGFVRHNDHQEYEGSFERRYIEDVYKGAELWHKLTYEADMDTTFTKTVIWNVIIGPFNGYIDKIEIYADDKKIFDGGK